MVISVLIVDDDVTVRTALGEALAASGYEVEVADGATAALAAVARQVPDVVVSDVRMPDTDGLQLLQTLRERVPLLPVVLMTAFDDMPTVVEAMKHGAVEFLVKPLDLDELQRTIDRVAEDAVRRRGAQSGDDAQPAGGIIGRHASMIDIYKRIGQAATTRSTVLIRGESGTGKELVARAIHAHSPQTREPFVPVNCAALPASLLESELFGHVRGAFTGAVSPRRGRFALAGCGTIFLDEIGDTTLDFQTKLLRVLQDREFQPVGSDETQLTEARVIAATHQPLETLIVDRRFRQDLYYRLRVVEIVIPPLRERASDIPLLSAHIIASAAESLRAPPVILAPVAMARLMEHTWPGNVRELENCLMRAIIVAASGGVIREDHLSIGSPGSEPEGRVPSLGDIERDHVLRVLAMVRGHKGRASVILGVSRPRLNRLIDKYGLE